MKRSSRILIATSVCFACWLLSLFTNALYMFTDNVTAALIINGVYKNPLSQYQHPIFCLFVNLLGKLFPFADIYTTVVHALVFFELFFLMLLLPDKSYQKKIKNWQLNDWLSFLIAVLSCFFLSEGIKIWRANYTIQAASLLFVGWTSLFFSETTNKSKPWVIAGTILVSAGYMLRKEAGLLFVPFVLLMIVVDRNRRSFFRYILPASIAIIVLFISQTLFNFVEPYAKANRYNEARTTLVDYPVKAWNQESFTGISKADYNAATRWLYADTEIITTEKLELMAEYGKTDGYSFSEAVFRNAFSNMKLYALGTDVYMSVMFFTILLMGILNVFFQKSGWYKAAAILAILGAFIILLYFTFRGRALIRVWQTIFFAVLFSETTIMLTGRFRDWKPIKPISLLLISCLLYYAAGQIFAHMETGSLQFCLLSMTNVDDSVYEQTFNDDDLYIWPSWYGTIPEYFGDRGKLPTQRVLEHNIALGDWTFGQPYYTAFLERIGHPNPIRDLVEKDNVYIMGNGDYILNFLREHYGEDIVLVEAGEVNGVKAYKVERNC